MLQPSAADIHNWLVLTRARIALAHQPARLADLMRSVNDNHGEAA
jgi:hypothetical protein